MNIKSKSWTQKMIIIFVALILFNFTVPVVSNASLGSLMLQPIKGLFLVITDSLLHLVEGSLIGFENVKWDWEETDMESVDDARTFDAGSTEIPDLKVSPDEIFMNKIESLNANFFRNIENVDSLDQSKQELTTQSRQSNLQTLKQLISNWYTALRYIAIIGLLCVLVYIGIRIVISATAGDKAKYKKMLMDWVVALCLIFFLHYIMAFGMELSERMTKFFAGDGTVEIELMNGDSFGNGKGNKVDNFLEFVRVYAQLEEPTHAFIYLILYIVLAIYTVYFAFIYLKRFLYLAFLTLIAPLVALTYPLDKISDGQAQAFNIWLKEYMYNALLQPFHALIYRIFVLMSMNLAGENLLYTCVVIGFMIPAEKFLKKMFGFDKATTASPLGAMATGAAMNRVLSNMKSKANTGHSNSKGGNSSDKDNGQIKFKAQDNGYDAFGNGTSTPGITAGGNTTASRGGNAQENRQQVRTNAGHGENSDVESYSNFGDEFFAPTNTSGGNNLGREGYQDGQGEGRESIGNGGNTSENRGVNNRESLIGHDGAIEPQRNRRQALGQMFKDGAKDAGSTIGRNLKKLPKTVWNNKGKVGRWVAKKGLGAVLGAGIGTVGLAAGIATGDPSKALTMAGLGIGAGFSVGGKIGDGISNQAGKISSPLGQRYRDARYGIAGANEKAARDSFLNDKKAIQEYKDHYASKGERLNTSQVQKRMEEAWQYKRLGLSDEQARKAMKFHDKVLSDEKYKDMNPQDKISRAAKTVELADTITENELNDEKKLKARRNSLLRAMNGDENKVDDLLTSMADYHYMDDIGDGGYRIGSYNARQVLNSGTNSNERDSGGGDTMSRQNSERTFSASNSTSGTNEQVGNSRRNSESRSTTNRWSNGAEDADRDDFTY